MNWGAVGNCLGLAFACIHLCNNITLPVDSKFPEDRSDFYTFFFPYPPVSCRTPETLKKKNPRDLGVLHKYLLS